MLERMNKCKYQRVSGMCLKPHLLGRSLRWEDWEFKASLDSFARSCLKNKTQK
jgi:hypothetical protein